MSAKYDDAFLLSTVKDAYSSIAQSGATPEYATTVAQAFGYTVEQLQSVPIESHMGLGCGNPTVTATLKPGETVLDLGSGGGIDIFLAAEKVGPTGTAIGLDMSADMVKKARANAAKRGYFPPSVCFVECSLTDTLPIKSNSIDCVLSNCVINLLPPSGKTHIFGEIYRVLKPGGRVVLDDILAKEELPPHIRDDMKQYVSCIGGAVEVHEYDSLLTAAGFNDSVFVDNRADLNIYLTAATSGAPTPSCCAPSAVSADAKDVDLNHWAASYQIYARKPDTGGAPVAETPLERWWDAFPTERATNIKRLSPPELEAILRNGADVAVIDVRGSDRSGGHVKGSHVRPAQTFHTQLASFHAQFANARLVVFYCGSSRGRGPRCAGWYQDFLDAQALRAPEVRVLDGGMHAWLKAYSADAELTEGFPGEGETGSVQGV
ncbi:S-adenosyl-L-methionine-dependent methyltransferase [Mycena belliarum]|uniref:Arsenite methyltransferase n=1 Tax=Mycena belliarum TaxID=1033014 RepID=A0AAD6U2A6_9AGAR|nr:S-adenosyl-L-methionine-dependent methyltransferase [Mycena belliae]